MKHFFSYLLLSLLFVSHNYAQTLTEAQLEEAHNIAIEDGRGLLVKMNGQRTDKIVDGKVKSSYWCVFCKLFKNQVEDVQGFDQLLDDNNVDFLVVNYPDHKMNDTDKYQWAYLNIFGNTFPQVILLNSQGIKKVQENNKEALTSDDYRLIEARAFSTLKGELEEATKALGIN